MWGFCIFGVSETNTPEIVELGHGELEKPPWKQSLSLTFPPPLSLDHL